MDSEAPVCGRFRQRDHAGPSAAGAFALLKTFMKKFFINISIKNSLFYKKYL